MSVSTRPSMVISPFASLTAGEARSASAPMVGEACVLTDQQIEDAIKRLSRRPVHGYDDEEEDLRKLRRFSGESAAIARLHDEGQASLAPRQLDDYELERAMNESTADYQTYLSEGEGTASEEWRQDRSLNTESPRLHAAMSGSLDSLRSSSGGADVLQAFHAMLEKSGRHDHPAAAGQSGRLPFRRTFSASQAATECWRSQLRGSPGAAGPGPASTAVSRPIGLRRQPHPAGVLQDEQAPPSPVPPPLAEVDRVLPAVGTWAGRTGMQVHLESVPTAEDNPMAPAPLRSGDGGGVSRVRHARRGSSADGRIDAVWPGDLR